MKAILLILTACLSACTYADKDHAVAVGGKGAYKGKTFALTWDNEKSFNDVAVVGLAAVPAIQAVKIAQDAGATDRLVNTNAAKTTINASNNAAKVQTASILHPPAP